MIRPNDIFAVNCNCPSLPPSRPDIIIKNEKVFNIPEELPDEMKLYFWNFAIFG